MFTVPDERNDDGNKMLEETLVQLICWKSKARQTSDRYDSVGFTSVFCSHIQIYIYKHMHNTQLQLSCVYVSRARLKYSDGAYAVAHFVYHRYFFEII